MMTFYGILGVCLHMQVSQMINQTKGTAGAPCWHLSTNVFLESILTDDLNIPLVQQNCPPGESRSTYKN